MKGEQYVSATKQPNPIPEEQLATQSFYEWLEERGEGDAVKKQFFSPHCTALGRCCHDVWFSFIWVCDGA